MSFVDSIEKDIILRKYLQTLLPDILKDKGKKIIISFLSILEIKTKTDWLDNFLNDNTRTIICIDIVGMGVDILDIRYVI